MSSLDNFRSLLVEELGDGRFSQRVVERNRDALPEGEVIIRVNYSSLNYKDALSATGNRGVTRSYPHVPGIDAAGLVVESTTTEFQPGDTVVVMGFDFGSKHAGGLSEYACVPSEWVVKLPPALSMQESMYYGTAGFTAALSIYHLINAGVTPGNGDVLVTGATGGVGSIAVAMLAGLGFSVFASTGKTVEVDYLKQLGAMDVIPRETLNDTSGRALLSARWAGVVDTVGGNYLSTAIRSSAQQGVITCCGNVAAAELRLTVYPFILRGVRLIGIDSTHLPKSLREEIWQKISTEWRVKELKSIITEVPLDQVSQWIEKFLAGKVKGRVLVSLEAS